MAASVHSEILAEFGREHLADYFGEPAAEDFRHASNAKLADWARRLLRDWTLYSGEQYAALAAAPSRLSRPHDVRTSCPSGRRVRRVGA